MNNDMNNMNNSVNNNNSYNSNNIHTHSGHKTGEEIYHTQEITRKKNETELNVYRDKNDLNRDFQIIFIILSVILLLIILIMIF